MLMPGYRGRPDLTAPAIRDGWLFTGDLARTDEEGFLNLVDRKKNLRGQEESSKQPARRNAG